MTVAVAVQYGTRRPWAPGVPSLRRWAQAAAGARARGSLTIRVVDAAESRRLNRSYRGHDQPTNVLSFDADRHGTPVATLLGDLAICAPLLAREAREQGKTLCAHWAHMAVHGTLHLLGHRHDTAREAAAMEARERAILATLGYDDPYEVR